MVTTRKDVAVLSATCLLCHTVHESVSPASPQIAASWTCARCGQTWTAARLKTVAAYKWYVAARSTR
jgi:transposase-like protein